MILGKGNNALTVQRTNQHIKIGWGQGTPGHKRAQGCPLAAAEHGILLKMPSRSTNLHDVYSMLALALAKPD
jgi:hypothetical protein